MLPDSVEKLNRFCAETELYPVNAHRFRAIVNRVEARGVKPEKLAKKVLRALSARRPKRLYKINRNPGLLLLDLLPQGLRLRIIRRILSEKNNGKGDRL